MPKISGYGKAAIFELEDLERLYHYMGSDRNKLFYSLLRYTGERISAICKLEWKCCYERKGKPRKIILYPAKSRKASPQGKRYSREVPAHPRLREELLKYDFDPLYSRYLFPGITFDKPMVRQTGHLILDRGLEASGLKDRGYSSHSFRRTLITLLHEKGISARQIQGVTGHASLSSVQEYLEYNETEIAEAISLL